MIQQMHDDWSWRPSIIPTKIQVPFQKHWLARPRVEHVLNGILSQHLTWVTGVSGYGKTSAVAQWLRQQTLPRAWLSLDHQDVLASTDSAHSFVRYWVAAHELGLKQSSGRCRSLLNHAEIDWDEFVSASIHDWMSYSQEFVLVIDNCHHLMHVPEAEAAFQHLLEYLPEHVHIVLISPFLPLWAKRSNYQPHSLLIDHRQLSFTPQESALLIQARAGVSLSEAQALHIERQFAGWAVGVEMLAQTLRDQPQEQQFAYLRHENLKTYLTEKILYHLTPEQRQFLAVSTCLKRFSAELCQFVVQDFAPHLDMASLLEQVKARGLFIISLDAEGLWYQYHDVMYQFIEAPAHEARTQVYQRASLWFEQQGLLSEAVDYAQATQDAQRILDLIERYGRPLVWQYGEWSEVERWLIYLPSALSDTSIPVALVRAAIAALHWRFDECRQELNHALRLLQQVNLAPEQKAVWQSEIDALELIFPSTRISAEELAQIRDKLEHIERHQSRHLISFALMRYADKCFLTGDFEQCKSYYWRAIRTISHQPNVNVVINSYCTLATLSRDKGELSAAFALCQEALAYLDKWHLQGVSDAENVMVWLGVLYNDRAEFELAEQHLLQITQQGTQIPHVANAYIHLIRTLALQGRYEQAHEALQGLGDLIARHNLAYMGKSLARSSAWLSAQLEERKALQQWLKGLLSLETLAQQQTPNPKEELDYLMAAHAYLVLERYEACLDLLQRLEPTTRQRQRSLHLQRLYAMQASALYALGESSQAFAKLAEALNMAEQTSALLPLAELGKPLMRVLSVFLAQEPQPQPFAQRVLELLRPKTTLYIEKPLLSYRELEVLRLVAIGYSNNDIAAKLVLSTTTVKTHLKRIYDKLGADNRTQAINLARQQGML